MRRPVYPSSLARWVLQGGLEGFPFRARKHEKDGTVSTGRGVGVMRPRISSDQSVCQTRGRASLRKAGTRKKPCWLTADGMAMVVLVLVLGRGYGFCRRLCPPRGHRVHR